MQNIHIFKEYSRTIEIKEMAFTSGIHDSSSFSLKSEWNSHFKKVSKKVISNLPKNYEIYNSLGYYFLTQDGEYLGYVQLKDVSKLYNIDNVFQIKSSNQTGEVKGFYNIMFSSLINKYKFNIISDNNLSTNAIKSYTRLNKQSKLNVQCFDQITKQIKDFDETELTKNPSLVVYISNSYELTEVFNDYLYRINNNKVFMNELRDRKDSLVLFLFSTSDTIIGEMV